MFIKLVRLGADALLRFTPAGKPVINVNCAYDVGYGKNKKTQWIEVSIWDKQAESLAPYLTKGKQIVINAEDLEVETFTAKSGEVMAKLKCRAIRIDLCASGEKAEKPAQSVQTQQPEQQEAQGGFDGFEDSDIPFNRIYGALSLVI